MPGTMNFFCIGNDFFNLAIKWPGCRAMMRKDKMLKGFLNVKETFLQEGEELNKWLDEALRYNSEITFG